MDKRSMRRRRSRQLRLKLASAAGAVALTAMLATPAPAALVSADPVSTQPDLAMPDFGAGTVWAVEPSGPTAYVAGVGLGGIYRILLAEHRIVWRVPGDAKALLRVGASIYVGTSTGVTKYTPPSTTPNWTLNLGNQVTTIEPLPQGAMIVAGGDFAGAVVVINADGTRNTSYQIPAITGRGYPNSGPTGVYRADLQPHGTRYIAIGEFTTVGGLPRSQAFMLNFGATGATVSGWDIPSLHQSCADQVPAYLRDAEWNHAGSRIAFTASGKFGHTAVQLCDTVAVVNGLGESGQQVPTISRFCGDTGHSVEWTPDDTGIFVQGHFKCVAATPGTLDYRPRFGIALMNSDLTLNPWRSDKCRGVGGRELAWDAGLLVGYDCDYWGNDEGLNPNPTPRIPMGRFAYLPQTG